MSTAKSERAVRVWWIPQVPGEAFRVPVPSVAEGLWLTKVLAEYDKFQFEQRIKPDYCNVGGVEVLEDGEWCEYEPDEDEG
jgi:hypothetical protein